MRAATSRRGSSALLVNVIIPANERCNPKARYDFCVIPRARERVHDASNWPAELFQLLDHVALTIAAMNHDRKVVLVGQGQVAVEPCLLFGEGSVFPVPVQAGLADGDHSLDRPIMSRMSGQSSWPVLAASLGCMPTAAKIPGWS